MDINELPFPEKPKSFGRTYEFPEDTTILTSEQIGKEMSKLAAFRGYVVACLARAEVKKRMLEERHKITVAEECRCREDGNRTIKAIKDEVLCLDSVKVLSDQVEKSERNTIIFGGLREVYTGQIEVLSRELTRRSMLMER